MEVIAFEVTNTFDSASQSKMFSCLWGIKHIFTAKNPTTLPKNAVLSPYYHAVTALPHINYPPPAFSGKSSALRSHRHPSR